MAREDDLARSETGIAIAKWYRTFHSAGRKLLADGTRIPSFLRWKMDELNPESIEEIGKKLDLAHNSAWRLAAENIFEELGFALYDNNVDPNKAMKKWTERI